MQIIQAHRSFVNIKLHFGLHSSFALTLRWNASISGQEKPLRCQKIYMLIFRPLKLLTERSFYFAATAPLRRPFSPVLRFFSRFVTDWRDRRRHRLVSGIAWRHLPGSFSRPIRPAFLSQTGHPSDLLAVVWKFGPAGNSRQTVAKNACDRPRWTTDFVFPRFAQKCRQNLIATAAWVWLLDDRHHPAQSMSSRQNRKNFGHEALRDCKIRWRKNRNTVHKAWTCDYYRIPRLCSIYMFM